MDKLIGGNHDVDPPVVGSDCGGVVIRRPDALRQSSSAPSPAGNEDEQEVDAQAVNRPSNRAGELQVSGTAEVCCPADRVSVRVTNSISRRLEYILQAVRQHGVSETDASVVVTFSDFEKMERVCSILLEELDKSVCVGAPQFYHSDECLSQMRLRACVSAVENAQQKACEVSNLLGQTLGPPLLVTEEETKEWRNDDEEGGGRSQSAASLPHLPCTLTITASSRVSVSFSLRDRSRKKL
uniref:Interleukin-1 receptor-associated kinase 1 binding protein 1 n=1 Tax=Dicentrarchus labrax TaxID=13489 RepID=A0A8C4HY80_DICLA